MVFFWTVLYPGLDDSKFTAFERFTEYADHIAPAVFVFGEFILNRVPLKRKSLLVILPLMLIYALVNLTISLCQGAPVYPPLDPHQPLSYVIAGSLPLGTALAFLAWESLVRWKLRRY